MNYELLFGGLRHRRIRFALSGARGSFGRSLLAQSRLIPALEVAGVCDLEPEATRSMLISLGFPEGLARVCASKPELAQAGRDGALAIVRDPDLFSALQADILVEATGQPEFSAQAAARAIRRGMHVAMVSKETDSVVGPWLNRLAVARNVVYTTVDGDQPSSLIGLVTWARVLGFEVVAAGKSSEYDFVFDPANGFVAYTDLSRPAPELEGLWRLGDDVPGTLRRRAESLSDFPQSGPPEYCEMGVVANSSGLAPACDALHYPLCRTSELAEVFIPREDGGILERTGVVDAFHCLRRPDEASFSGGVFVVVRCTDEPTWKLLRQKGHLVSRSLKYACIYKPYNLLGLESPISLFSAVLHGRPSGASDQAVRAVMVARTERDFGAGETLAMGGHHHKIEGVRPLLLPVEEARGRAPFYLAANRRLRLPVPAGTDVAVDALDLEGSALYAAWAEQAATIPAAAR